MDIMKAASTIPDLKDIKYPVLVSPKLDGIRCYTQDGKAWSRQNKLIPNRHIQEVLSGMHGDDGELMIKGPFEEVDSAIMSRDGKPDFYYAIFDHYVKPHLPFSERLKLRSPSQAPYIAHVPHMIAEGPEALKLIWDEYVNNGYEGAIVRDPSGKYKFGRSTLKQGLMLKLKHFKESEAVVVGFQELLKNLDTSSKRQENMIGMDTLGALCVSWGDIQFKIGSGFTQAQRAHIWTHRSSYLGQKVTFKYQELTKYNIPRFPTYKGFRSDV